MQTSEGSCIVAVEGLHEPVFHTRQDFVQSICFSFSASLGIHCGYAPRGFCLNFKSIKNPIMTCEHIHVVQTLWCVFPSGTERLAMKRKSSPFGLWLYLMSN